MSGFSESSTVQTALVELLSGLGWTHRPGQSIERSLDAVLVESEVVAALVRLNPRVAQDAALVDEVLPLLRLAVLDAVSDGLVAANERLTTWLRGNATVRFTGDDDSTPIVLIDLDEPKNNVFWVSDELTYEVGGRGRRFDLVLWVNGFPFVIGETKTPLKASVSWLNGARDIHDIYEPECAPFFASNLLSFSTEGKAFHYGAVGQPSEKWLPWGSTSDPYDLEGWPRVKRSAELLLTPRMVLTMLRDFVLYDRPNVDGKPQHIKLLARYPQVEAAMAIHDRVLSDRRRGLIHHHQGTGKTLLAAFAALQLLNDDKVGGPTVLVVLDRLDLVDQTMRQFRTAGLPRMEEAKDKDELRRLLKEDRRGIIVTTVFRFEGAGLLNDRDNIVVLVDEAHRTQEGTLGDDMRTALPNAKFFGFTGTPVSDRERNTFKLFGDPDDPGWILNQYTVERSIADGSSVPIHVEPRQTTFHFDRAKLDEAYKVMADEEGLTDEERDLLAAKATSAKAHALDPKRITAICADIVEHYFSKVAPLGLKAQVVALDRELCVLYFDEITRLLAERGDDSEAAVVMTVKASSKEDPKDWARFELSREDQEKVVRRFNTFGDPLRFLIVTAKLLTGFDSPIDGVMYLDKPLRLHTLFQAICRTNRRWTNPKTGQEKYYGLIVDYVAIGEEIGKALRSADPAKGGKRPVDVEGLLDELEAALAGTLARFKDIDRTDFGFEALTAAQERVPRGDKRDEFAADFTRVQSLWEFLWPNQKLTEHKADYRWLAQVYESVKPSQVSDALLWQRLGAKTLALVHGQITNLEVTGTGLDEVIVDEGAIEVIRQLTLPGSHVDPDGALTVGEALDTIEARIRRRLQATDGHSVFVTLSERLDRLRRSQLDKASASIEFLREILQLAQQVTAAEKAEEEGRLDEPGLLPDPNIGALSQILEEFRPENVPVIIDEVVSDVDEVVRQVRFTGWNETQTGDRTVRKELRLILKRYGLPTTGELFDRAYAYIRENY